MEKVKANALCMICGSAHENPENACCINDDHDDWLEVGDSERRFARASRIFNVDKSILIMAIQNGIDLPLISHPAAEEKTNKIVIYLYGGLIQWVAHNIPDVVIHVLDGDTDGEGDLTNIELNDGNEDVYHTAQNDGMYDPEYVTSLVNQINASYGD